MQCCSTSPYRYSCTLYAFLAISLFRAIRHSRLVFLSILVFLFLVAYTNTFYTMLPLWARGGKPIVRLYSHTPHTYHPAGNPPSPKTSHHAPRSPHPPPPPRHRLPPPFPILPAPAPPSTRKIHLLSIPRKTQRLSRPPSARSPELHTRTPPAQEEGHARPRCSPLCIRPQTRARGENRRRITLLCLPSYA